MHSIVSGLEGGGEMELQGCHFQGITLPPFSGSLVMALGVCSNSMCFFSLSPKLVVNVSIKEKSQLASP